MKRIIILSLLFPLTMHSMESKKRPLEEGSTLPAFEQSQEEAMPYICIKAILKEYNQDTKSDVIILETDLPYIKPSDKSKTDFTRLRPEIAYPKPLNLAWDATIANSQAMKYKRAHQLTLILKSLNPVTNTVDIEYACERACDSWNDNKSSAIKTSMENVFDPAIRSITLGADPEKIHRYLYSLELSAWEQKSLNDK